MKKEFNVKGMHCKSCEMLITDSLEGLDGVKNVKASAKDGKVIVEHNSVDESLMKKAIESEGYKVE